LVCPPFSVSVHPESASRFLHCLVCHRLSSIHLFLHSQVLIIDVPLIVPKEPFPLDKFLVPRGVQEGETLLPESTESTSSLADPVPSLPPLNETAYLQLQEMGFPANRAEKALRTTGNANAEVAMQWLFEHMDDVDIDVPYDAKASMQGPVDAEKKINLMAMGFEERMVEKALRQTVCSLSKDSFPF
jgi:ubiquitin carboxyl-terminal hydrolase 5/13